MAGIVAKLWEFCHLLRHDGINCGGYIGQLPTANAGSDACFDPQNIPYGQVNIGNNVPLYTYGNWATIRCPIGGRFSGCGKYASACGIIG